MQTINWKQVETRARRMSRDELAHAIADCRETIRIMGTAEMIGKDSSYYSDELSVYARELKKRERRAR